MNLFRCNKVDCTVSSTGVCLELFSPLEECPNIHKSENNLELNNINTQDPYLEANPEAQVTVKSKEAIKFDGTRQFYSGLELGIEDAIELMRRQYVYCIGILGQTDVGKTAYLSALYLMAVKGLLKPQYIFAGSTSLQGFEDRARGLRRWENGSLSEKFMDHTQLQEPRNPSFMHLKLKKLDESSKLIDLLLTDLPGEWTEDLINRASTAERFAFLKRADGFIYVIDGKLIEGTATRHIQVHKAKTLFSRLKNTFLLDIETPIILLISKCDETEKIPKNSLNEIIEKIEELGFKAHIIESACVSRNVERMKSGTGVKETLDYLIKERRY